MKYIYALFCLLLLVACAPRYAPPPQPVYQPPVYQQPPAYPPAYPQQAVAQQQAIPPQTVPQISETVLGGTHVTWHPYLIGNTGVTSARPSIPGVLKVVVKSKAPTSPPITEGVTILATAYYPDGTYENFGTSDIEGIMPSNILMFDHSPGVQAYTNDKQISKGDINTVVKYVILVKYKDKARVLGMNLNVR